MERITKYDAYQLPAGSIYYEPDFNCRSEFTYQSVEALARSISENGLEFPLIVQPMKDAPRLTDGFDWRLLCGHRRYRAVTLFLKWVEVPCVIREGLTPRQAEVLNLNENLERKDLNPLEEALAIRRRYPDGVSLRMASQELKRDTRWVHQRLRILQLPAKVQEMVAAGLLTLLNVEILVTLKSEAEQLEVADKMVAVRRREQRKDILGTKYCRKFRAVKNKKAINRQVERLLEAGLGGLITRFGAWCAGYINDDEWEQDFQKEIKKVRQ